MKTEVDLNVLGPGKLDLSKYAALVTFSGTYSGDRIIIDATSASGKRLVFKDACITNTISLPGRAAIAFDGHLTNCEIVGDGCKLIGGGIDFWGHLLNVSISRIHFFYPPTALKVFKGQDLIIEDCIIVGAHQAGICLASSSPAADPGSNITVRNNWVLAPGCEAIRAHAHDLQIHNNLIEHPAMLQKPNEDTAITILEGSTAYVWDNEILTEGKAIQALNCTFFDYPPHNNN